MNTVILPMPTIPSCESLLRGSEAGNVDPSPVREPALHRYQARARAVVHKDDHHMTLIQGSGKGIYFTPIIRFLILAEAAVLTVLSLIVFW
jgi:hypothetical protein